MGVHTGEAALREGDYYGTAVNRAARVSALATAGSSSSRRRPRRSCATRGTGGFDARRPRRAPPPRPRRPERGLPGRAPPVSRRSSRRCGRSTRYPSNLPRRATSFVGRDEELAQDRRRARARRRLVTLTGRRRRRQDPAGAAGRRRGAARSIPTAPGCASSRPLTDADGARAGGRARRSRCSDAPLDDSPRRHRRVPPVEAPAARARQLRAPDRRGARARRADRRRPAPTRARSSPPAARASRSTGSRSCRSARSASPEPTPTSTSSWPTRRGAALHRAGPGAPSPTSRSTPSTAPAVAEICRRLDGMPLAIELAAARAVAMSPAEIASLLDERFRLLTGGRRSAVERHQTLRATVDWSYALLDERERLVFDRLGVFAGTSTAPRRRPSSAATASSASTCSTRSRAWSTSRWSSWRRDDDGRTRYSAARDAPAVRPRASRARTTIPTTGGAATPSTSPRTPSSSGPLLVSPDEIAARRC